MTRICLVHGWNVRDGGQNSIDRMAGPLTALGYDVDTDEADYGYLSWQMFSWVARNAMRPYIIERLKEAFKQADVVLTHSNGANFVNKALHDLRPRQRPRLLMHFSPALDRDTPRPQSIDRRYVFHTKTDMAVRMATYIPFHPWGRMGAWGYDGIDPRTINMDYTGTVPKHSDWFRKPGYPKKFAEIVDGLIKTELW